VKPRQLLTGKIIGLGIAGLVQAVIWLGTSYVLLRLSGRTFQLPSEINISISFLTWGIVFFLLGYAVYASLMAGLGALVPNLREASQATIVIMIPMMIPMMLSNTVFAQAPNGVLAVVLSLFPLSAPIAMLARLSMGGVAWWQPIAAAVLLALTALVILRAVARMFRAQSLLAGQGFKLNLYFRALLGREI
jgi:ABC-2 type transport system permease protein